MSPKPPYAGGLLRRRDEMVWGGLRHDAFQNRVLNIGWGILAPVQTTLLPWMMRERAHKVLEGPSNNRVC